MKLFLGDQVAGALGQMAQDLECLRPQLEFTVVQTQATASEVQHETIKLKYAGNNLVHILLPADRREKVGEKSSVGHLRIRTCGQRAFSPVVSSFAPMSAPGEEQLDV